MMEEDSLLGSDNVDSVSGETLRSVKSKITAQSQIVGKDTCVTTPQSDGGATALRQRLLSSTKENKRLRMEVERLKKVAKIKDQAGSDEQSENQIINGQVQNEYKEKYVLAFNQLQPAKGQLATSKRECDKMRSVLLRELGSESLVEQALKQKEGSWQGRAQEITDLKKRLKACMGAPHSSAPAPSIVVDHKRTNELEALVKSQQDELAESSRTRLALKSRNDALEDLLAVRKNDLKVLMEKNDLNNKIISELRKCVNRSV